MLTNITEIVLIVIIILLVFGVGRLPRIASWVGRLRSGLARGLEQEPIDITPRRDTSSEQEAPGRKPGKFEPSIEDARVDEG